MGSADERGVIMYKIIDKNDKQAVAAMSRFVRRHDAGHFLQTPAWADVKERWDWRGILVFNARGELTGSLSVLIRPIPFLGSILYAPRGPVCNRHDGNVIAQLLAGVREIASLRRGILFYMDPDIPCDDRAFRAMMTSVGFREREDRHFGNIQAQHVFRLNLDGRTEDEVFSAFHQKTRYNIRLASRRGVKIQAFSGAGYIPEQALSAFSRLMDETGRRDGFVVRDKEYFRRIFSALGGDAVLYLAYLDGKPIAGTIGVFHGRKAWYLYGASGGEHRGVMPNYLLQWTMIRRAIETGCVMYDLRGVPGTVSEKDPLHGLYRFKKGFSGDYTKFAGLFTLVYRPIPAAVFSLLLRVYRSLVSKWARLLPQPRKPERRAEAAVIAPPLLVSLPRQ